MICNPRKRVSWCGPWLQYQAGVLEFGKGNCSAKSEPGTDWARRNMGIGAENANCALIPARCKIANAHDVPSILHLAYWQESSPSAVSQLPGMCCCLVFPLAAFCAVHMQLAAMGTTPTSTTPTSKSLHVAQSCTMQLCKTPEMSNRLDDLQLASVAHNRSSASGFVTFAEASVSSHICRPWRKAVNESVDPSDIRSVVAGKFCMRAKVHWVLVRPKPQGGRSISDSSPRDSSPVPIAIYSSVPSRFCIHCINHTPQHATPHRTTPCHTIPHTTHHTHRTAPHRTAPHRTAPHPEYSPALPMRWVPGAKPPTTGPGHHPRGWCTNSVRCTRAPALSTPPPMEPATP